MTKTEDNDDLEKRIEEEEQKEMDTEEQALEIKELNERLNVTMALKEDLEKIIQAKNILLTNQEKWIEKQTRRFGLLEMEASGIAK